MSTNITSVSPAHLHLIRSQGEKVDLVDVRTPAEYRAGHALGAQLVPLDELGPETLSQHVKRPGAGRESTLYLLCKTGLRAQQAAERLGKAGYRNLALVEGGTEAWEEAGLPMQRCGKAMALERQVQIAIGVLLLLKVMLGFTLHELFFAATALVGTGLIVAGTTRWCGMAHLVAWMPWNRKGNCAEQASA